MGTIQIFLDVKCCPLGFSSWALSAFPSLEVLHEHFPFIVFGRLLIRVIPLQAVALHGERGDSINAFRALVNELSTIALAEHNGSRGLLADGLDGRMCSAGHCHVLKGQSNPLWWAPARKKSIHAHPCASTRVGLLASPTGIFSSTACTNCRRKASWEPRRTQHKQTWKR